MASDIDIAQAATPRPISHIADQLSIPEEALSLMDGSKASQSRLVVESTDSRQLAHDFSDRD